MRIVIALITFVLAACAGSLTGPLGPGSWGGPGIQLDVSQTTLHAEFDCGSADAATKIDVIDGSFTVQGYVTVGHGGPIKEGEQPDTRPATFSGTVNGNQMSLNVIVPPTSTTGAYTVTYTLVRGAQGTLHRCL